MVAEKSAFERPVYPRKQSVDCYNAERLLLTQSSRSESSQMISEFHSKLEKLRQLLAEGNEQAYVELIDKALVGDDDSIRAFLVSNELWGGSGSIADNCLLDAPALRKRLMLLLIELGQAQTADDCLNVRTHMWVSAFQEWIDEGVV
jgi:hypothetical protein